MPIKSVLAASPIADVCYLQEALYWLAIGRFPIAALSPYGDEHREDDEWIDHVAPDIAVDTVSKGECDFAGLPVNPTWALEEDFYHYVPSVELEIWLSREQDPERRKFREADLEKTKAYEKSRTEWELAFNAHLDFHAARLFIALREGKVPATGKRVSNKLLSRLISDEHKRQENDPQFENCGRAARYARAPNWNNVNRESIPADYWVSTNIEWQFSCSRGRDTGFGLILIETATLLEVFPIPESGSVIRASQVGDSYVLLGDQGDLSNAPMPRRGRPSFRWDEFNVEIAKRAQDGSLPGKQEAMIVEMQIWCKKRWGVDVARSTLLQKIKPYYDELVRKSENKP